MTKYTLRFTTMDEISGNMRVEEFSDTFDGLLCNSIHPSMHTFQSFGQCVGEWHRKRGYERLGYDWEKWVAITKNDINEFVAILNDIEQEEKNWLIKIGSNGILAHTIRKYALVNTFEED